MSTQGVMRITEVPKIVPDEEGYRVTIVSDEDVFKFFITEHKGLNACHTFLRLVENRQRGQRDNVRELAGRKPREAV